MEANFVASEQVTQAEQKEGKPAAADESGDYFSGVHNTNHFSLEPNPFEQSFGNPAAETPGKSLLPPVAALTSPSLPGVTSAPGYWPDSLRAGPLSPAMLAGPAVAGGYFESIARGFPTPNESSMRTGLTPGGGGSMFPAPSPSGQPFPSLQSGTSTPSTLEFQRTALNAARKNGAPTSNPQDTDPLLQQSALEIPKSGTQMDPFTHPDATDAANGILLLAKGGQVGTSSYPQPTSQPAPSRTSVPITDPALGGTGLGGNADISMNGNGSDGGTQRANTRSSTRKKSTAKATTTTTGRRKAEETKASSSSNKRQKQSNGEFSPESDAGDNKQETGGSSTGNKQKLTDEEKRRNFLERNRYVLYLLLTFFRHTDCLSSVAALKCRQRKKQWLSNLQAKVELYSTENEKLMGTVTELRNELMHMKQLLMAHKDCPMMAQTQGLLQNGLSADYSLPPNPYSMALQGNPALQAQGIPRR